MISLFGHVWARAERRVSAIQPSELYAGIRIDTSGFIVITSQHSWQHVLLGLSCLLRQPLATFTNKCRHTSHFRFSDRKCERDPQWIDRCAIDWEPPGI